MVKKKRRVKRRLKVGRILIALIILGLLIFGIYKGGKYAINKLFNSNDDKPIKNIIKKEDKEKVTSASLIMVGDNLIHSSIYNEAHANGNYTSYDFKPMYSYIKDIVKDYDIAYYNQETILGVTDKMKPNDYPTFNTPTEAGDAMIDAGFNLVSLATNHTLDSGSQAVENSCEYWKKQTGVMTAGSYCSEEERNEIKIAKANDITYTMLNYTYGTNGIPIPSGKEYYVNVWPMDYNAEYGVGFEGYKEQVKKDIERVRDKVDVLIVAMHWGVEYTHEPTKYEKEAAEYLASLGVDIIIGTHPHVVQPVTWIDDTLVIYSLGNFISAQEINMDYAKMVGLMSSVKITKTVKGDDVKITLSDLNNDLIFTRHNSYHNFKVVPFSSPDIGNYIGDYERLYNKYSAVIKNMDDTVPVAALAN